ncbi:MAG: AfsR/SARP family transcriptional regulator [Vulcanimicrobiaceae bacterium]
MIASPRRQELANELRRAGHPIALCAPPGYGKSTFAAMLRDSGVRAPIEESRARPRRNGATIIGLSQLAFDEVEMRMLFAPFGLSLTALGQIVELTRGWPAGALYFRRLAHLGVLDEALADLRSAAYDDLYDYLDEQVLRPCTRGTREALLLRTACEGYEPLLADDRVSRMKDVPMLLCDADGRKRVHPLLKAAVRARQGKEMIACCLRRSVAAERGGEPLLAARWAIVAEYFERAAGLLDGIALSENGRATAAALPFAVLLQHPRLWTATLKEREARSTPHERLVEATAIAQVALQTLSPAEYAAVIVSVARAHMAIGNLTAALATCEDPRIAGYASSEIRTLRLYRSVLLDRMCGDREVEIRAELEALTEECTAVAAVAHAQLARNAALRGIQGIAEEHWSVACAIAGALPDAALEYEVRAERALVTIFLGGDVPRIPIPPGQEESSVRAQALAALLQLTGSPANDTRRTEDASRLAFAIGDRFMEDAACMLANRERGHATIEIALFRGEVRKNGIVLSCSQRECAVIFTLAAAPDRAMNAQRLAESIWPDHDSESARRALKVAVSRLRARVGYPETVSFRDGRYALSREATVDLVELTAALSAIIADGNIERLRRFRSLVRAARPPRLCSAEWFAPIEARLNALRHELVRALAESSLACRDAQELRALGLDLLATDSCDEYGCELVMRSSALEGDARAAIVAYERFAQVVRNELGAVPSLALRTLAERFRQ